MIYIIRLSIIHLIIILSFSGSLYALGKALSMGGVSTIVSDGPFDAAKNPALLSLQHEKHATGISLKYLAYSYTDVSIDVYFEGLNPDADFKDKEKSCMACYLAYSIKIGNPVIGFAITDSENGQFYSSKQRLTIKATDYKNITDTEEEGSNPVLHCSIGFDISNKSSMGFRISTKYRNRVLEEKSKETAFLIDTAAITKKLSAYSFSYSIGAGYLYKEKDTQLGFYFDIGEFTWYNKKFSYNFKDLNDSGVFVDDSSSDSESYSSSGKYTKGMGFTAGGYRRINPLIAIALEGEFRLENSYKDTSFDLNEDEPEDAYSISETKNNNLQKNSVFLHGGVEINPYTSISIMFGGGYIFYQGRGSSVTRDSYSSQRLSLYLLTFGAYYQYSKNISLSFNTLITELEGDSEMESHDSNESFSLDMDTRETNAYLSAGVVYTF